MKLCLSLVPCIAVDRCKWLSDTQLWKPFQNCRYAKQDPQNVFYSVKRFIGRTLKEVKQEKTRVSSFNPSLTKRQLLLFEFVFILEPSTWRVFNGLLHFSSHSCLLPVPCQMHCKLLWSPLPLAQEASSRMPLQVVHQIQVAYDIVADAEQNVLLSCKNVPQGENVSAYAQPSSDQLRQGVIVSYEEGLLADDCTL